MHNKILYVLNRISKGDMKQGQTAGFEYMGQLKLSHCTEYKYRFPRGFGFPDVEGQVDAISATCGKIIELKNLLGGVIVRVVMTDFPLKIPFNADHLKTDKFLIGYDRNLQPVYHSTKINPHLLIAGQAGYGKTVQLKSVLLQMIIQKYDVRIVDMKGFSFDIFAPDVTEIARNLEEAKKLLKRAYDEMQQRQNDAIMYGVDYLKDLPHVAVIVDEGAQIAPKEYNPGILRKVASECDEYCAKISQLGREMKVSLIYATQRPDMNVINRQVKANMETSIAFRTKTVEDSKIILGVAGAEKLPIQTPGRCIYGSTEDITLQVPYISDYKSLLLSHRTEIIDAGSSQRKHTNGPKAFTDGEFTTNGDDVPRLQLTDKEGFEGHDYLRAGEINRREASRQHGKSVEVNERGKGVNEGHTETRPLTDAEAEALLGDW